MIGSIWWWLLHVTGSDNVSGPWYGFWSGFGSDLAMFGGAGALAYGLFRRHNCHVKGCWRIGRHPVQGTGHVVCAKHHPLREPTHADVLDDHARANQ